MRMSVLALLATIILGSIVQAESQADLGDDSAQVFVTHADIPRYPPVAWGLKTEGAVVLDVTVDDGKVVSVREVSNPIRFLSEPSIEHVMNWQVYTVRTDPVSFEVTYIYRIEGSETEGAENAQIRLELPHLLEIVARPIRPTRSN